MPVRLCSMLSVAGLVFSSFALPAFAQNIKPGLWEMSSKVKSGNGEMAAALAQMQKQLATMPPEQRKALTEMMAKHGGAEMPTMKDDGSMVTKVCMSKEMVANQQLMQQQTRGNCTQKNGPMVGNTMTATFNCTNPEAHGTVRFQFKGDSQYSMAMTSTGLVNGKQEAMSIDADARWLAGDCGKLKPLGVPPPAK